MRRIKFRTSFVAAFTFALIAGLTCFGCGSSSEPDPGGDDNLIGTWVGTEIGGSAVWSFTFNTSSATVTTDSVEAYTGNWTATPTADPKQLSLKITACDYAEYVGKTSKAIYKIDADVLTFAGNEPGVAATPTSFTSGGGTRVFELTKQ
ncbi:MAG: hypothetical protein JRJ87_16500 [Deltaproteobacteria bacterium]|nr:hypothetical protein [Deltaproteobacteria bacterium]